MPLTSEEKSKNYERFKSKMSYNKDKKNLDTKRKFAEAVLKRKRPDDLVGGIIFDMDYF